MNTRCQCCLLMLWARAIGGILAERKAIDDILMQRNRHPSKVSDKDFLRECTWAIYSVRTLYDAVLEIWEKVEKAFCHWDYELVCKNVEKVRSAALNIGIRFRVRKAEAVIKIAQWMCQTGWQTIRKQLLYGLTQDGQGNFLPRDELIAYLDQRPMIGRTNAIYILKNVGYDIAKPDIHLTSLAPKFGYATNERGVNQFATDISQLVLERISVVDTVLWWADKCKVNLSFQCPTCRRQHGPTCRRQHAGWNRC